MNDELDEEIIKKFKIFHQRAEDIYRNKFLRTSFNSKITAEKNKPVKLENNFPEDDLLRSFVILIKPFYSKKDSISFNRICNIICNSDNDFSDNLIEQTKKVREAWNKLMQTKESDSPPSGTVLVHNNEKLTASKLIDLYFNGYFFHTDLDKHEKIQFMKLPMFTEQVQMNLFDVLQKMGQLIIWFDKNVIEKVLLENNKIGKDTKLESINNHDFY